MSSVNVNKNNIFTHNIYYIFLWVHILTALILFFYYFMFFTVHLRFFIMYFVTLITKYIAANIGAPTIIIAAKTPTVIAGIAIMYPIKDILTPNFRF